MLGTRLLLFAVALVAASAAFAALAGIAYQSYLTDDYRGYVTVASLAGLILVLLLGGKNAGAATGAGVVMLGLVAAVAVFPALETGGEDARGGLSMESSLERQQLIALRRAETITLDDSGRYNGSVTLRNGFSALKFTPSADRRLQIDVRGVANSDPKVWLYEIEGDERRFIEYDDDGGDGYNAQLVFDFEAETDYALLMQDLRTDNLSTRTRFEVSISSAELEDIVPDDRRAALALVSPEELGDNDEACGESSRLCRFWEGVVRLPLNPFAEDENTGVLYMLNIEPHDEPGCLFVDAVPLPTAGGGERPDTFLFLRDRTNSAVAYNDDVIPDEDLGSRIVHFLEPDSESTTLLVDVLAYSPNTSFSLYVELKAAADGGQCAPMATYERRNLSDVRDDE